MTTDRPHVDDSDVATLTNELDKEQGVAKQPMALRRCRYFKASYIFEVDDLLILQIFPLQEHQDLIAEYWVSTVNRQKELYTDALHISEFWEHKLPDALAAALSSIGRTPEDSKIEKIHTSVGKQDVMSWCITVPHQAVLQPHEWMAWFLSSIVSSLDNANTQLPGVTLTDVAVQPYDLQTLRMYTLALARTSP